MLTESSNSELEVKFLTKIQFREENEALRIQFEAVTLNPRIRQFSEVINFFFQKL